MVQANKSAKEKSGRILRWGFSQSFSGPRSRKANSASSSASTPVPSTNPQEALAKKPILEPFLDQSINNTELGKARNEAIVPNTHRQIAAAAQSCLSEASGTSTQRSNPIPAARAEKQSVPPYRPPGVTRNKSDHHSPQEVKEGNHDFMRKISGSQLGISRPLMTSKAASTSTKLSTSGVSLNHQDIEKASYAAAASECKKSRNRDVAAAQNMRDRAPVKETFLQLEEYQTLHEVVEQFVEHNYFILEHVIKVKLLKLLEFCGAFPVSSRNPRHF